jgi:hypothetical protein
MRLFFLFLFGATCAFQTAHAQNNKIINHATERILEEKLRGYDIKAMVQWQKDHPGEPLAGRLLLKGTTPAAQSRDADQIVATNPEAESEVHAAINPADSANILVAGVIQDPSNFTAPLDIPVRYTKNFGQTWQTSTIDFSPSTGFAVVAGGGDPVIAFDKSGKAYLSWLVLTIDFLATPPITLALYNSTSNNKGQTWGAPVLIDKGTISLEALTGGGGSGDLVDKQWMATDQSATATEGNLYVSYTRFEIIDSVTSTAQILLKKKAKTSNTFSATPVQVHTNTYGVVQFSSIVVDAAGRVHVSFFGGNSITDMALYHTVSTDAGATFAPETKISDIFFPSLVDEPTTDTIPGVATDRLYPCPHIVVGKGANTLIATWTSNGLTSALTPGYDIWLAKSTNNGNTWSTPKKINPGTNPDAHQFYSALNVSPSGTLCVSYYDRTEDPSGTKTHYVLATSNDDGATFKPSVNATSEASDFSAIGSLNGGFGIGEYTQVVTTPYYAIPVWSDGRTNDGNIELYAAFIPITGTSSLYEWGNITNAFDVVVKNPSTQSIDLQINMKKTSAVRVQILTSDGRLVADDSGNNAVVSGSINRHFDVQPGTYYCKIETAFGAVVRKVLVVQ